MAAAPHDCRSAASASERAGVWVLRALIALGLAATAFYFSWWAEGGRITSPLLALLLLFAALYHWTQLISGWMLYLAARRRGQPRPDPSFERPSVDVFVTACGESPELVERSLRGVVVMRGDHHNWLLDDGDDPRLARLAERLGVGYLTREGRQDRKAGNVNAALARTDGEIVVIFDVDHVPTPDFLERTIDHFADPSVGFVQVMLTFSNEKESWFARAASESGVDFFNPTSIGMDRLGSATLIGSNALIRRRALESIGRYRPGLAEDLATSVALHAGGWRSVYVAEPLAPGLAPADVGAWFTQQLKWARGVFDVLLTSYPRLFTRLTWGQRLSYAVRMTYYWTGPVTAVHLMFTVGVLIGGERVARINLQEYIVHLLPLILVAFAIRMTALWCWRHPSVRVSPLWRAVALVHATWPVYCVAWLMAVVRWPLGFRATPKSLNAETRWNWLVPQIAAAASLGIAVLLALASGQTAHLKILVGFCALQSFPQVVLLWQSARLSVA